MESGTKRRRQRRVGNPLSRRSRGRTLSKSGLIAVSVLVLLFASAAIYVCVLPLILRPQINSDKTQVFSLSSGNTGLRASVARGADWMEQEAEAQAEQVGQINLDPVQENINNEQEHLIITLSGDLGKLKIRLLPHLSPESIDYLHQMVDETCERCQFYRAEKQGILQGVLASSHVSKVTKRGACPVGLENIPNDCPEWDPECGCHGPIMTNSMVAWAGGDTGPDFFINAYQKPAKIWGTQHTVWGELLPESLATLDKIWSLPSHRQDSMMVMLDEPIHFTLDLEKG